MNRTPKKYVNAVTEMFAGYFTNTEPCITKESGQTYKCLNGLIQKNKYNYVIVNHLGIIEITIELKLLVY